MMTAQPVELHPGYRVVKHVPSEDSLSNRSRPFVQIATAGVGYCFELTCPNATAFDLIGPSLGISLCSGEQVVAP